MNPKYLTLAALIGSTGLAHAELTTSSDAANFSGSATVSATANSVASATTSNNNAAVAAVGVNQFDASTGVLTRVDLVIDSTRSQTISGTGSKNNGPGRDANGSGTSTAALTAPGASSTFATPITAAGTGCSLAMGPTGAISCGWGPVNAPGVSTGATASVGSTALDSYAGAGTTAVALSLPSLQATSTLSRTQGQASSSTTAYTVNWSGSVQANYGYLLHAAPTFDALSGTRSLTLDFGTLALGSSAPSLSFALTNQADPNRAGLDLDTIAGSGDVSRFSTNLAAFSNLGQGQSQSFQALLDTTAVGGFNAHYLLTLSDADVGASATRGTYQLDLNLKGNVAAVPEPETYAMLMAGLGLLGGIARRRRSAAGESTR